MKRRDFLGGAGAGALLTGGLLAGCRQQAGVDVAGGTEKQQKFQWKMVTTWPKNFPGLGTGANRLASMIEEMSGGRIVIKVYGAKELVPAFEVFGAVSQGTAQMGHGASYYWKGKSEAAQFFAAVPFGLTADEMNAWLYHGGGMELWRETYAPFGLVPMAAGNTGVQMGGWFNREINSLKDLEGLKMRIPGLGGEVLRRAGGTPVTLPASEIFTSLPVQSLPARTSIKTTPGLLSISFACSSAMRGASFLPEADTIGAPISMHTKNAARTRFNVVNFISSPLSKNYHLSSIGLIREQLC